MALTISLIENFLAENGATLRDRSLLRHDRYKILFRLRDEIDEALKDYESFESEFASLVMNRIQVATSYDELLRCHLRTVGGVTSFFLEEDTVIDVHDLFRLVRDAIAVRVLELVEQELESEGLGKPPADYVWVALGSEGRDEQTMLTDQDNMIIYSDRLKPASADHLLEPYFRYPGKGGWGKEPGAVTDKGLADFYFEVLSERAVERLHEVGFERCKGNVMPVNPRWRGSVDDWLQRIDDRLVYQKGFLEPLDLIILSDARAIKGDERMLDRVMERFFHSLRENKQVMKDFVESAVLMPTALSFFGNFKTEKSGEHKDKFNVKLMGWAPLILAVRMAALSQGILERNTLRRVRGLRAANMIKKEMENDLIEAYLIFVRFRIMNQIEQKDDQVRDPNWMNPDNLTGPEQERMRKAMKSVESLQKYMQETLLFGQPI